LECGGATIVIQSRATGYGRYRRFECKECRHRFNITYGEPRVERLIDDATVMAIRQSTDGHQSLADQHGCSRELIRQIRNGSIYKDLLPYWFRSPPKAGDPNCQQCKFWSDGCSMGFPDAEIEGPRFARDCSVFEAGERGGGGAGRLITPPTSSAPCCVSTPVDQQSPAG
jgi:hypothetical protein